MFGMGQYEKVGDSAKVRIRRGVCFVSILFFLYILSSSSFFVVLRCFVVRNRGIQFSLSLSFIHSFLFHSCAIRAQQSSPSTVLFKTSDHNSSCSNTNGFYYNKLKTDPRQKRRGQQIEIFRHQRHGQFRGSLGVPENHRHRVRENYDGERVGDTKREKNART
jgi:hypothetical protein